MARRYYNNRDKYWRASPTCQDTWNTFTVTSSLRVYVRPWSTPGVDVGYLSDRGTFISLGHTWSSYRVSMEHFKYSMLKGVDVILEVKRVWMCWSILPAFRFPKFSVCVVFVNMNNMLACFLYRWTTLLNLDEQLCWIFGPPRSCAGARKSLVFKVEENNMSMNMLVTVLHWVYGNSLDRTLSVFCCTLPLSLSMVQLILQQLLRQLLWQLS